MFIIKKTIIKTLLLKRYFRLKYESSIHNIALSSEKVVWSESGEKYAQIKQLLQALNKHAGGFWREETTEDRFFTGGSVFIMEFWLV